jgi:phytoene dehydrogenase-like protein
MTDAMPVRTRGTQFDAVIVGGGHNGLVAAVMLARAGRSVLVLERAGHVGGAAVNGRPFAGVDARLSRYAYLVSLFPAALAKALGVGVQLRRRAVSSYTPTGDTGLLVEGRGPANDLLARIAERLFPTLTEPLLGREQLRRVIDDDLAWRALFEEPLSEWLAREFDSDVVRGVVLTDGLIGTFASAEDLELRQNRCFLYHVIGNGTGDWDVPVGGMGALTDALASAARGAGAELRTDAEVTSIATDGRLGEVTCADGERVQARHVLANVAPAVLSGLLGESETAEVPEGSQLKLNMLLARLPPLRDRAAAPERAFAGTFHVNESYEQLQRAYEQAARGAIPSEPPCELYCHSLTDPSILSPELRAAGAHTLTLFGLHMPARLFGPEPGLRKQEAVAATLRSVNSVLAEPLEDCLFRDEDGEPCLEALTPVELEAELRMPGGHIFHRDLSWPYAETEDQVGAWGVETSHPNLWLCGAGAHRGGGVSGIPGHNAARAALSAGL